MEQLIDEANKLYFDIKNLHKTQNLPEFNGNDDEDAKLEEVKDKVEGLWDVDQLIRELYSISDKFIDYKHGLVSIPNRQQRADLSKQNKECTFHPRINKISAEIEKRNWQFRMQIEEQQRQRDTFYPKDINDEINEDDALADSQSVQELMFKRQMENSVSNGRQALAGKIVKRKEISSQISVHNQSQSQLSHVRKTEVDEARHRTEEDEFDEIKKYPMGELLLREEAEDLMHSMS